MSQYAVFSALRQCEHTQIFIPLFMCKHSDFTYNEAWYINKIIIVLACVLLFQVGIRRACFNVKCSGTYRNLNESTHFVLKSFKKISSWVLLTDICRVTSHIRYTCLSAC